jgi:hypothetical protein
MPGRRSTFTDQAVHLARANSRTTVHLYQIRVQNRRKGSTTVADGQRLSLYLREISLLDARSEHLPSWSFGSISRPPLHQFAA